jgi:hypothetical protein
VPLTQVQQNTGSASPSAGGVSVVFGAGPTQNNLLLCAAMSSSFGSMTSSGWTQAVAEDQFDAMYLYYKIAGAGESSTVTWTPTVNDRTAVWIAEYSGNVTVSPLDKTAVNDPAANASTIATGTTAALSQADELAVAVVSAVRVSATTATINSYNNSFTEIAEVPTTGADYPILGVATRDLAATTAITTTATFSVSVTRPIGMIATFKAAAAGGVTVKKLSALGVG